MNASAGAKVKAQFVLKPAPGVDIEEVRKSVTADLDKWRIIESDGQLIIQSMEWDDG